MDLRMYFQKVRKLEREIPEPHVIVVSSETPAGGADGVKTEVARDQAARLVVEGRARLATPEEADVHRAALEEVKRVAEQRALADKVQINVISDSEIKALKKALLPKQ